MKFIAVLLVVLVLAGCNTAPVASNNAIAVLPDSASSYAKPSQNGGEVTFIRDSGWSGGGCSLAIYVAGQYAANLHPSEKVDLYFSQGDFVVSAKPNGPLFCGTKMAARAERSTSVTVHKGTKLVYRIATSSTGDISIMPVID